MEFLSIISKYGTGPLVIILMVIVILLMKEHKKAHIETDQNLDELGKRVASISEEMAKDIKKQFEIRDKTYSEILAKLDNRILYIEQNYAEKSYVQETVSGWRTEIKDLGHRIDDYNKRIDRFMENRK